jgi:hypothetical protein
MPSDASCVSRDFSYSAGANTISLKEMFQSNASYHDYGVSEEAQLGRDRLPPGPALLVVLGLSLLAWAVVLAPLVAILHQ